MIAACSLGDGAELDHRNAEQFFADNAERGHPCYVPGIGKTMKFGQNFGRIGGHGLIPGFSN